MYTCGRGGWEHFIFRTKHFAPHISISDIIPRNVRTSFLFFFSPFSNAVNFISVFYHLKGTERRMKLTPPPPLFFHQHVYMYNIFTHYFSTSTPPPLRMHITITAAAAQFIFSLACIYGV